ncbi:MAG: nicotinate (nicotinamide) nucleotide adenylyltransferase [Balneolaceae bacterium]|nr:nicotinate (nicotinamide) nucleotide adenylyltransferase [Balneolaceae bacterium]
MGQKIGLFGGTFDPVHNGHVAIVNSFLDSGFIDELWIIPAPSPPHKSTDSITGYEHRKRMLELVFKNRDQIHINDIEQKLTLPSYTIQTIRFLKQKYTNSTFFLCIGEDSLASFDTWYKPDQIVEQCTLLVARRPGSNSKDVPKKYLDNARFVDHEPVDLSASELREQLQATPEKAEEKIPAEAMAYIKEHHLYQ